VKKFQQPKDKKSDGNFLSLDSHKLIYHLKELNAWIRGEPIFPLYVAISPSGMCNHKCVFCVYEYIEEKPIFLEKEKTIKIIKELRNLGTKAIFFSGEGEPLLNKFLPEIVRRSKDTGIDMAINTNGIIFNKGIAEKILKNFTFVRVSLNAGKKETYASVHGTRGKDFDIVLSNLSDMVQIKIRDNLDVTIGVQFLLLNENRFEVPELAKKLRDIGVGYLSVKPFLPHPNISYRLKYTFDDPELQECLYEAEKLSSDKFSVIIRRDSFAKISKRSYPKCLSSQFMLEIDCHGDVYPCGPFLGNKKMVYGNIYNCNTFEELWNSERCKKTIAYITNELDVSKCMPNCRNDAINRFLWELVNPPEHVNYI